MPCSCLFSASMFPSLLRPSFCFSLSSLRRDILIPNALGAPLMRLYPLACLSDFGCPFVRAQANDAKRSAVRVCLMRQALLLDQFQ